MARINTYDVDVSISDLDKLIGVDADDSGSTKTFTIGDIKGFIGTGVADGTQDSMAMFSAENKVVDASPVAMSQSADDGGTLYIDGNIDGRSFQLSTGQVAFTQTSQGSPGEGIIRWNDTDGTLDLGLKGGNVTLQIGQEQVLRVVNGTGGNLLESQYRAVKVTGAQGQRLQVDLAQANSDVNSVATIGLVTEDINNNQQGFVTVQGVVNNINTTGSLQGETWSDGDVLYLSAVNPGVLTNVKPVSPNHLVIIGFVEYAHQNNGKIFVKVDNGYELEELHDVKVTSVTDGEMLVWNGTENVWFNDDNIKVDHANARVGIGISAPADKLHVNSGIANEVARFESSGATAYISIMDGGTSSPFQGIGSVGNDLAILANNKEQMRVLANGNIGIGTLTPSSILQVVGGGIQTDNDTAIASLSKVGTLRYRTSGNNSYVDMCMQTGAATYSWVNIKTNSW